MNGAVGPYKGGLRFHPSVSHSTQNNMRLTWTGQEVNTRLKTIMGTMHQTCLDVAERYGTPDSYIDGANIGGFVKVAEAMIDQGLV